MATTAQLTRFLAVLAALALVLLGATTVSTPSARAADGFAAHGSARQVYVTGLPAGASATLVDGQGATVRTQQANPLGGVLFRDVAPGEGYRVREDGTGTSRSRSRSTPRTPRRGTRASTTSRSRATATATSPPATARSSRSPCTRRPSRRPRRTPRGLPRPQRPGLHAAVPDADRVLGLRLRQPRRPDQRHRGAREPDGLRGRRRQHARHRLLGRRLRLLRAAAEPRRLRRHRDDRQPAVGQGPQGRDDGHLLRRHQPAVHRAAPAAVASRRSHRCRCSTPPRRRSTRAASSTPASPSRGPRSASSEAQPAGTGATGQP